MSAVLPLPALWSRSSILITGGTGYLARGLVRKLLDDGCRSIGIYSRGEFAQAEMRREFQDDWRLRWFIGDVREQDRLREVMERVDIVIHAAALKRIEVGAHNPGEMVKTNVWGSQNVIDAAKVSGVDRVLLVSSDKAFEPRSAYGQTKALAESLFLSTKEVNPRGPRCSVCRYGNVAGSTGSVIPTWRRLIAEGKEVHMTHPDCTRFWMTRDQAVSLVLNTVRKMRGGELEVPTLPAFRLGDLAEAMGARAVVKGIDLSVEKLHESMGPGNSSDKARRMTVEELRGALEKV